MGVLFNCHGTLVSPRMKGDLYVLHNCLVFVLVREQYTLTSHGIALQHNQMEG